MLIQTFIRILDTRNEALITNESSKIMKIKTIHSPNGDEARFEAAITDFEAYEAIFAAEERIRKLSIVASIAPFLEVHHLDSDRYLVLITSEFHNSQQFPEEAFEVEECYVSTRLNAYALFVRSRVSPQRLRENVSLLFFSE